MVTLIIRGGEIVLHPEERFNTVRNRLNKAKAMLIDYQNGNLEPEGTKNPAPAVFKPFHLLSFRTDNDTDEGGRISLDVENIIGVMSDEPKDGGGEDE